MRENKLKIHEFHHFHSLPSSVHFSTLYTHSLSLLIFTEWKWLSYCISYFSPLLCGIRYVAIFSYQKEKKHSKKLAVSCCRYCSFGPHSSLMNHDYPLSLFPLFSSSFLSLACTLDLRIRKLPVDLMF